MASYADTREQTIAIDQDPNHLLPSVSAQGFPCVSDNEEEDNHRSRWKHDGEYPQYYDPAKQKVEHAPEHLIPTSLQQPCYHRANARAEDVPARSGFRSGEVAALAIRRCSNIRNPYAHPRR